MIKMTYKSSDGYRETRSYKTLAGAKAFLVKWLGPYPDVGRSYAVSPDGIGVVVADGALIEDILAA